MESVPKIHEKTALEKIRTQKCIWEITPRGVRKKWGGGNPPVFRFLFFSFFLFLCIILLENCTREPPITQEGGMGTAEISRARFPRTRHPRRCRGYFRAQHRLFEGLFSQ